MDTFKQKLQKIILQHPKPKHYDLHFAAVLEMTKTNEYLTHQDEFKKLFPIMASKIAEEDYDLNQMSDTMNSMNFSEEQNDKYSKAYAFYSPCHMSNEQIHKIRSSLQQADPRSLLSSAYAIYLRAEGILNEQEYKDKLILDTLFLVKKQNLRKH